jgi:hypothetical protein
MAVSIKIWQAFASNHSTAFTIVAEFKDVEEARELEKRIKEEIGEDCIGGFLVEMPAITRTDREVSVGGHHELGCKAKIVDAIAEYISGISRPLRMYCEEQVVEAGKIEVRKVRELP